MQDTHTHRDSNERSVLYLRTSRGPGGSESRAHAESRRRRDGRRGATRDNGLAVCTGNLGLGERTRRSDAALPVGIVADRKDGTVRTQEDTVTLAQCPPH